jgi:hypothetical protein
MGRLYFLWLVPLLPFVLRKIMVLWGIGINGGFWNFLCYAEIFSSVFVCMAVGFLIGQSSKEDRETEFKKFKDEHLLEVRKMSSECWEETLEVKNENARLTNHIHMIEKNERWLRQLLEAEKDKASRSGSQANKDALLSITGV